jgi:hypothetical protein
MPLTLIITAAKTVSRASAEVSFSPLTIRVTISATSMTVTATASTREPNGSPTRWATTSAWWTAASTAPTSAAKINVARAAFGSCPQVRTSRTMAATGVRLVHDRQAALVSCTSAAMRQTLGGRPTSSSRPG